MHRTFRFFMTRLAMVGLVFLTTACGDGDPGASIPHAPVWPQGELVDLALPAANQLIVLSAPGEIYLSLDGGSTFDLSHVPASGPLRALSMATPAVGFAVGPGVILRTEDGGKSWRRLRAPRRAAQLDLLGVAAIDVDRAVAIGSGGLRLRTVDGGAIWQEIPEPGPIVGEPPTEWTAVSCLRQDGGRCWVAGDEIHYSEDAGATWRSVSRGEPVTVPTVEFGFGQFEISPSDVSRIREAYAARPAGLELDWRIDARVSAAEIERIAEDGDPQALFELIDARGEELRLLLEGMGVPADKIERAGTPPWGYEEFLDDDPELLTRYWAGRRAESPQAKIHSREPLRIAAFSLAPGKPAIAVGGGGRGLEAADPAQRWLPFRLADASELVAVGRGRARVVAVGRQGGLWSRSSAEVDWQPVDPSHTDTSARSNEADPDPHAGLRAIGFDPLGEVGYVVGAGGRILVSRDAGIRWQGLEAPGEQTPGQTSSPGSGG